MPNDPTPEPTQRVSLSSFGVEIDIIVFTLLINLGFLKITEVSEFIGQITNSVQSLDLLPIILISVTVLSYIIYALAILVGLVFSFQKKNPRPAMVVALIAFFIMYGAVFFNAVGHAQLHPGQTTSQKQGR
ncbi:MAG TPA: hypothetical protein VK614_08205 [Allosphingosinicella sp.]|nr:hypothetical protein [Allosphingosinicella sp.]